jgi:hypothetical protein
MKRLIVLLLLFLTVSSMAFSQFVLESPVIEFDVDFGKESFGILRYYGYRPTEDEFWLEVVTGSIFNNLIDPPESLMLPSFTVIEDNTALDDFVKTTMRRNNITVCITYFSNNFDGYTYIVNYSFDNYKTFGFVSMDSIVYKTAANKPEAPPIVNTIPRYTIVTGKTYATSITQDELRKRINLQNYNDIVSWLRWGSNDVVESSGVQFDRLINVLVNNFKSERSVAENSVRNIGNNVRYQWLVNSYGRVTEWIVYFKER